MCKERTSALSAARFCAMLAVVIVSGCTTPYRTPCIRPANAVFPGLADAFKDANGSPVPVINLILVHGMGSTDYSWVQARIAVIAPALGFTWDGAPIQPTTLKNGAVLYQKIFQDSSRRLNISAVLWSPITASAKASLCYDVTSLSSGTPRCTIAGNNDIRASGNALLKNVLMDDRLSDVTFYLGRAGGQVIRDAIEDALLRALSPNGVTFERVLSGETAIPRAEPVFLMSESLGSKIVVDSLEALELLPTASNFADVERSHVDSLYLLANQIPILGLGEPSDSEGRSGTYGALQRFAHKRTDRRNREARPDTPLRIVAFSDPNDVFSYQLSDSMFAPEKVVVSNVVISNDTTYFGFIENPINAHTGYIGKTDVVHTIARGSAALEKERGARCAPAR
jgi:hypothetical protein